MSQLDNQPNPESLLSGQGQAGIQTNVNTHFDATVAYWDAVYRGEDLQGVIYQQRQVTVLRFIDEVDLPSDAHVLEIGCGAGHLTRELARRNLRVDAVDASPGMVELTREEVRSGGLDEKVTVGVADVHSLPFAPQSFDMVVAVGVIPWLHSPASAVSEMARVLTAEGQLVVTADNAARLSSFTDPRGMVALTPLRRVYHSLRKQRGEAVSHLHFPRHVDALLQGAGLEPVSRATCGFGPLSFLGKPIFSDRRAIRINARLQRLADRGAPGVKWAGWHYVTRAVRR